jgi:hypothetical protein
MRSFETVTFELGLERPPQKAPIEDRGPRARRRKRPTVNPKQEVILV